MLLALSMSRQITFREWMHLIPPIPAFYNGFVIDDFDLKPDDKVLITVNMGAIAYVTVITLDTLITIQQEQEEERP